jgi:hypothetical protein
MKHAIPIALAALATLTGHATGQPPSTRVDWTKPVIGVDAPTPPTPEKMDVPLDLIYAGPMLKPPLIPPIVIENPEAAAAPLPPPCEAPLPRTPAQPPGPPAPAPAPCRP